MLLTRPQIYLLSVLTFLVGCGGTGDQYQAVPSTDGESAAPATDNLTAPAPSTEAPRPFPGESPAAPAESLPAPAEPKPVPEAGSTQTESGSPADDSAAGTSNPPEVQRVSAAIMSGASSLTTSKPVEKPLEIKVLIPNKEFTREGADKALRVTFDDLDLLKVCNMEPVPPNVMDYLPDWLKNLNGQKVILRGWMFPSGRQEGISSFMFVRDNGICCFGRDPKVYDKLAATMQPGQTTSYIAGRPFDVEATLLIEPDIEGPEEGLWWLYRLENVRVIDH